MINIGVVVGKFAPLTRGHINLINHAATASEKLIVVVSHDQKWLDAQSPRDQQRLTWQNRVLWLKSELKDLGDIKVEVLDESEMPAYPNGWEPFTKELAKIVENNSWTHEFVHAEKPSIAVFSSELEYDAKYQELLPDWEHVVVDADRTRVPVSATKIRDDLYRYWEYLPSIVRQDYTLKVCLIGLESVGKTTLAKMLAKLYGTSWVEEYGRTYCEQVLCGDERLLKSSDYPVIAYHHKELEREAMRNANRVCFVDTNAFVTELFHRLYEGHPHPVTTAMAHDETYDLIIVLGANVPWVNDGLRINADRSKPQALYDEMVREFSDVFTRTPVMHVTGNNYTSRLKEAMTCVEWLLTKFNIH